MWIKEAQQRAFGELVKKHQQVHSEERFRPHLEAELVDEETIERFLEQYLLPFFMATEDLEYAGYTIVGPYFGNHSLKAFQGIEDRYLFSLTSQTRDLDSADPNAKVTRVPSYHVEVYGKGLDLGEMLILPISNFETHYRGALFLANDTEYAVGRNWDVDQAANHLTDIFSKRITQTLLRKLKRGQQPLNTFDIPQELLGDNDFSDDSK